MQSHRTDDLGEFTDCGYSILDTNKEVMVHSASLLGEIIDQKF